MESFDDLRQLRPTWSIFESFDDLRQLRPIWSIFESFDNFDNFESFESFDSFDYSRLFEGNPEYETVIKRRSWRLAVWRTL